MLAFTERFYHDGGKTSSGKPKRSQFYHTLMNIKDTRNETNHRGMPDQDKTKGKVFYENFLIKKDFNEVIDAIKQLADKVRSIDRKTFLAHRGT